MGVTNYTELRSALGKFATGVSVVTVGSENVAPVGITINAFCSVSLDPPQILFCLKRLAGSYGAVMANPHFAVNILALEQQEIAERCTRIGGGSFQANEYAVSELGIPVLDGCLATLQCQIEKNYPGGDHTIILGKVLDWSFDKDNSCSPLVFFGNQYSSLAGQKQAFLKAV